MIDIKTNHFISPFIHLPENNIWRMTFSYNSCQMGITVIEETRLDKLKGKRLQNLNIKITQILPEDECL